MFRKKKGTLIPNGISYSSIKLNLIAGEYFPLCIATFNIQITINWQIYKLKLLRAFFVSVTTKAIKSCYHEYVFKRTKKKLSLICIIQMVGVKKNNLSIESRAERIKLQKPNQRKAYECVKEMTD